MAMTIIKKELNAENCTWSLLKSEAFLTLNPYDARLLKKVIHLPP
jgi:hypothetical protein